MPNPVLSAVATKDVLAHLFTKVLELHSNNITILKSRRGLWNYKKLHATSIEYIKRLYKSEHILLSTFQYLSDWKMFVHNKPYMTYDDIMIMTDKSWELINLPLLQLNYSLIQRSVSRVNPIITAPTVLPSQIEVTIFLKYCTVTMRNKCHINNFYNNLIV